jgi:hypothetical protein
MIADFEPITFLDELQILVKNDEGFYVHNTPVFFF